MWKDLPGACCLSSSETFPVDASLPSRFLVSERNGCGDNRLKIFKLLLSSW